MKKEEDLLKNLVEMVKETKMKKLKWKLDVSTTEYNERSQKPIVQEDGKVWTVDECYVAYYCERQGKEFLMITYEMIRTCANQCRTTNLVFLPPLGNRFFDINLLSPYALENSNMLSYQIHVLWTELLALQKEHPELVEIDANPRTLEIE